MCRLQDNTMEKKLYCLLTNLDYDFSKFELKKENRIIFQKLVYALQRNGFKFGYSYNLYINGPYSPELASRGYSIVKHLDELKKDENPFKLSKLGEEKLNAVKEYLNHTYNDSDWLETLATIDYLKNEVFGKNTTKEEIFERFGVIKERLYKEHLDYMEKSWEIVEAFN